MSFVNMEPCDCKTSSACTATSVNCAGGTTELENAVTGLWLDFNSVLTAVLTVVGYLLYKFSQALPALIRWPIRLFCTLTGLTALWSWVSHLVGTLRSIQSLFKWLSRIWRFSAAVISKLISVPAVIKTFTVNFREQAPDRDVQSLRSGSPREPGVRLILLGPPGGGRTSLADTLLGCRRPLPEGQASPLMESSGRQAVVDGGVVTVVDTPDLFGPSLDDSKRAREALRSLQLISPGPHAIMLVIQAPGSGGRIDQDAAEATRVTLELFGEGASSYIIMVLTHADCLLSGSSLAQLLDTNEGGVRTALSLCGQKAELVGNGPDCPLVARRTVARRLLDRVVEMRALRGHFTHELQRREDSLREELLTDMAAKLTQKIRCVN
ncbi:GTPase IMAP family member 4-like isoform X2 [Osmerus eperlanus]|uniref:GTPase IMAP family member 4-like isoform X2 n=1 Tax=Osmerus eperlanus TaxID=29151 RepID=UPI002E12406A